MAKISTSTNIDWMQVQEQGSAPATPSTGYVRVYAKSDGKLYIKDDAGTETDLTATGAGSSALPPGHLYGLTLSNNGTDATNDIDIATGKCRDSTDAVDISLASGLTKQLDAAWAVGTNQGGLDTGVIANTTYHVWLIKRSDTGVVDALFSASATTPSMPASYDYKRRIGSIVRTGGSIKGFVQDGDAFAWKVPAADVNAGNPGTAAVTRTLTVPLGIRVQAHIAVASYGGGAAAENAQAIFVSDLSITDTAASSAAFSIVSYAGSDIQHQVGSTVSAFTNTSGQVRSRLQASAANTTLVMTTLGWVDARGRI